MSVISELRFRPDNFVLAGAFDRVPDVRLDFVQELALDPQRPYLWVWARGDLPAFETAVDRDDTVAGVVKYVDDTDRSLYRIHVSESTETVLYPLLVQSGAEIIEAGYEDGWWHCCIRLPDREALGEVQTWFEEHDVEFALEGVYSEDENWSDGPQLTREQREVLEIALEEGYFDIPRGGDLSDVAQRCGISTQAASERLRRGHRQLVLHYL